MKTTSDIRDYLNQNLDIFIDELIEWLQIPSISTLSEHKSDVYRAGQWAQVKLEDIGFPTPQLIETEGHPLVYGEWKVDSRQPTLLIYGHYDVQPADPLDLWHDPPFEPVIKNGNLYGRGASDDKGQVMLVLVALQAWAKVSGAPPINIKILLEGEEEAGGASIAEYVQQNSNDLAADAVLICDTNMPNTKQPCIINSLRGILYTELKVSGAKTDLHSGSYGGVAPNPIHALCLIISKLKGEDGIIEISQLQEAIVKPSSLEKDFYTADPLNITAALLDEMGVDQLVGENTYPALERLGVRPTLEVHGIAGGFTAEGAKTVIPAEATAKISLRLPPHLDPDTVFGWLRKSVDMISPKGYQVSLSDIHTGAGVEVEMENHFLQQAALALEQFFDKPPVFLREGGSIPIAALFDEYLKIPVVLMGFALPDDNIHAPNEKFSLQQFAAGMHTVADYLGKLRV